MNEALQGLAICPVCREVAAVGRLANADTQQVECHCGWVGLLLDCELRDIEARDVLELFNSSWERTKEA
jgi:hypothetical protein